MMLEFKNHPQVSYNYLSIELLLLFITTNQPWTAPGTIEHQQGQPPVVALADQNQQPTDNRS
nr:MAG TPA: hypothetical protein [Caudoviricetes sp.]